MKHRRSIDLTPGHKYVGPAGELPWINLTKLSAYYVLGGECGRCGHKGWIDREVVRRRFGAETFLKDLRNNLVCLECENRKGNTFTIWKA
ncbi:hypothetical protein [Sinorhizobium meliloti]|uniref:hypothetical protein n=1 Tax=Rhizobium meliloti TaxID=382 RepID=UPI003F18F1C3